MKICKKCGEYKNLNDYPNDNHLKDGKKNSCKSCFKIQKANWYLRNRERELNRSKKYNKENRKKCNETRRKWLKANPGKIEKQRRARIYKKFKITHEQYEKMLKDQNNKCAICLNPEIALDKKTNKIKLLAIDHDHKTGKVRGLLCSKCNTAIGLLKENLNLFKNAHDYIKKHLAAKATITVMKW